MTTPWPERAVEPAERKGGSRLCRTAPRPLTICQFASAARRVKAART